MTIERLQSAIQRCWKVRDFLAVAVEGGPIEALHDRYLRVENPQFRPDNGSDPNLLFDLDTFGSALAEIEILTASAPASPAIGIQAVTEWLSLDVAPKDGTMVRLLVRPTDEGWTPFVDSWEPYETIGFNNLSNTSEDEWQFAGWDWNQDCFVDGCGTVVGWLPLSALHPAPEAASAGAVGEVVTVPEFNPLASRKLSSLLKDGWSVNGYAIQKGEDQRGFVDFAGFVGWWLPEYYSGHSSDTAPSPKGVTDGVREALEAARAHIITLGGNPHPHDQSADQIQVAVLAVINAALSQEPVPATAEERAAQEQEAQ